MYARRSPSPIAPTSSTTAGSSPPAPPPSSPTTPRPGRSTWARSSRYETATENEPAGRHDPSAAAGDPAPAAVHAGAGAGGAQGARGESAPRGGAGRERGEPGRRRDPRDHGRRGPRGDHLVAGAGVEGDVLGRQREGRRPALRSVVRGLRRPRRRADAGVHGGAGRAAVRKPRPQRHVAGEHLMEQL